MAQRGTRRVRKPAEEERDLRSLIEEEEVPQSPLPDFGGGVVIEEDEDDPPAPRAGRRGFGLSPMERAFLAVMLFLNVLILGAGILVVTGRVVF